jgi:biopolymer transport protein ExbD
MKLRDVLAVLSLAAVVTSACRSRSPEPSPPAPTPAAPATTPPTLKIWISKPGVIEMNGRVATLADVSAALDELTKQNGEVIFGQDLPDRVPHPNVAQVLKMVMNKGLTFRSAHDRSFSELSPDHHYDKSFLGRDP